MVSALNALPHRIPQLPIQATPLYSESQGEIDRVAQERFSPPTLQQLCINSLAQELAQEQIELSSNAFLPEIQEQILLSLPLFDFFGLSDSKKREEAGLLPEIWEAVCCDRCENLQLEVPPGGSAYVVLVEQIIQKVNNTPELKSLWKSLLNRLQGGPLERDAPLSSRISSILITTLHRVKTELKKHFIIPLLTTAMIISNCAIIVIPIGCIQYGIIALLPITLGLILLAIASVAIGFLTMIVSLSIAYVIEESASQTHKRLLNDDEMIYYLLVQARTHSAWERSHHTGEIAAFFNTVEDYDRNTSFEPKVRYLRCYGYKRDSSGISSYLSKIL